MDFRNVKSLMIGGKAVSKLLVGGRLVWQKSEPQPVNAYIETDGVASYMNVGFVPSLNTEIEITFMTFLSDAQMGQARRFNNVLNCGGSTLARHRMAIAPEYGKLVAINPTSVTDFDMSGKKYTVRISADSVVVNGEVQTSSVLTNPSYFETPLLGTTYPGLSDGYVQARYYSAKFWESGVLIRDLVPYSGPRGVGMLDKVHDVLYTNAGGGSLTYGEDGGEKEAYVQTKGLSDSFWCAPLDQLGCSVGPASPQQFGWDVDLRFDDGFQTTGESGIFGFTRTSALYYQNMVDLSESDKTVYAYAPGTVINSNGVRQLVTPGERHLIKFDFDPTSRNSVAVDGLVSKGSFTTIKLPYDTNFRFGGHSTSKVVTSVTRPVKMRVYGIRIYQLSVLVADLVPYKDGDVVGMMDKLSGRKFPGSNLEYGEE